MKYILALAAVLLASCSTVRTIENGPNGKPLHRIEGLNATAAYERAGEQCPDGYNIVYQRQQGGLMYIDIECK